MMAGQISVKAGRYNLRQHVWFEIRSADAGVQLLLHDEATNTNYSVTINELGEVCGGGIQPIATTGHQTLPASSIASAQWLRLPLKSINTRLVEAARLDPLASFPARSKHRFTLRYTPSARDSKQVWPMGGYQGGGETYVFYRRPGSMSAAQLLKVINDGEVALNNDADLNRMPEQDWVRFFHLQFQEPFTLNRREWSRMTTTAVAAAVRGRVFACWQKIPEEI